MRKMRGTPAAPVVGVRREQPRLRWSRRSFPHRTEELWADQLLLNGKVLGEVVPVIEGNPQRGRVAGYVFFTYAVADLHLPALHSGDRPGTGAPLCLQADNRAAAQVALATYVQGCLRSRGLRP